MRRRFGDGGFEILVVVNGSTDRTAWVARRAASELGGIRVSEMSEPVGKGGAVLEGFEGAAGRRVAFADADGSTAPESLLELFDQLDRHDAVIGSRRLEESEIATPQPPLRRAFGIAFAKAARLLFGMPFEDTQAGAKAFRRPVARRLVQDVKERHWTFDIDLLLASIRRGYDVHEHPVEWADRKGSRLRFFSTAYEVARALLRLKRRQQTTEKKTDGGVLHPPVGEPEVEPKPGEGI